MPRGHRESDLKNRTNREALPVDKEPLWTTVAPNSGLGYRRCSKRPSNPGRWLVRGKRDGKLWTKVFALADDCQEADGDRIQSYLQAVDTARRLAVGKPAAQAPITVEQALAKYEADLRARGGAGSNVRRARFHLTAQLLDRPVAKLTEEELCAWRDSLLAADKKRATINRTTVPIKAALNLAARRDKSITNRDAWQHGLQLLGDSTTARNVVLTSDQERAVITAAYENSEAFGLLVETASATGARPSQLRRVLVEDLKDETGQPRLLIPKSAKGKAGTTKQQQRVSVPIPAGLAARLRANAVQLKLREPLLRKAAGTPWTSESRDTGNPWAKVAALVGGLPPGATFYCLRHTMIVRCIKKNIPLRVIAEQVDTSTAMIEKHYSAHIAQHTDGMMRDGFLNHEPARIVDIQQKRRTS